MEDGAGMRPVIGMERGYAALHNAHAMQTDEGVDADFCALRPLTGKIP